MTTGTDLALRVAARASLALRGQVGSDAPKWFKAKWASAYFAGLMDGEGCIQVRSVNLSSKSRGPSYSLSVSLGMTDPSPVHLLSAWMARGKYRTSRTKRVILCRDGRDENRRPSYQITFAGKHGAHLLERILPFLVVKRPQARLALRFYHGWMNGHKGDADYGAKYNQLLKLAKKRSV